MYFSISVRVHTSVYPSVRPSAHLRIENMTSAEHCQKKNLNDGSEILKARTIRTQVDYQNRSDLVELSE